MHFTVTALDDTDPAPSVVCEPPPGSTFPRGTTVVTCTATDACGNEATRQFPVTVMAHRQIEGCTLPRRSPAPSIARVNAQEWSRVLRECWEDLATSAYRDYFVASHRGWADGACREAQARYDAAVVLHGISTRLRPALDVLEVGCGVGRLARVIAPQVRSYDGIDIAAAMVAEARARRVLGGTARFFVSDGLGLPDALHDSYYDLIFAHAVFIHLPREVIAPLLTVCARHLRAGGELRFQLRAERDDPTGIQPGPSPVLDCAPPRLPGGAPSQRELLELGETSRIEARHPYWGSAFAYAEVASFVRTSAPRGEIRVQRYDPEHIYVDVTSAAGSKLS